MAANHIATINKWKDSQMKAIVYSKFGPAEVLHLQEVEKPTPKEYEVLIKMAATTVEKEDPDMRTSPGMNGLLKPRNPILGQVIAGQVEAVGKKVSRFKAGDMVFGMEAFGAYAEYKSLSENGTMSIKPANISFEEAASIPNGGLTALPFLRDKGNIQPGQTVLIYGASGSVGTAAVQLARYFGAEVTGVCCTANLDWVRSLGADHVLDYTREDFTKNGKTYDIIFDTVGKRSFSECKGSLTDEGIYLSTVPTPAIMFHLLRTAKSSGKKVKFVASALRPVREKIKDLAFLAGLIEQEKYKPVVDRIYSLEQIVEAHRYVEKGHKKGSVVITMASR
jgi:NADPH:quinone reductase-like Zn-dependent oxidoreductase